MAYIYVNPYKSSYLAAQQELMQRRAELELLTQRIAQLEETVRTLEPLANEPGVAPTAGLPELCRQILMSQPTIGFSAAAIMQSLTQMGVDISAYANPLAVLHTTLGRICKPPGSGFVKTSDSEGQPVYLYDERRRSIFRRLPRFGVR